MSVKTFFLFLMITGFAAAAEAGPCSSPSGSEGNLRYDLPTKKLYYCNGTIWVEAGGGGVTSPPSNTSTNVTNGSIGNGATDNRLFGTPLIGKNGGTAVTLCEGLVGAACGGGLYAGDMNLVVAPGGCTGTPASPSCPALPGGSDTTAGQMQWSYDGTYSNEAYFGNQSRYGYTQIESMDTTRYPAAQYCKNLVYGGYSDWYLPTLYEMIVVGNNMYELGESSFLTRYIDPVYGNVTIYTYWASSDAGNAFIISLGNGQISGDDRTYTHAVRCVRRN